MTLFGLLILPPLEPQVPHVTFGDSILYSPPSPLKNLPQQFEKHPLPRVTYCDNGLTSTLPHPECQLLFERDLKPFSLLKTGSLPLGFTFSFPMTQRGLDVGVLVAWTKSFNCPGVIGQDAVKMLNEAIVRIGHLPVKVV